MISTIIKRDGKLVDYNPQKIINAIEYALKDTIESNPNIEVIDDLPNIITMILEEKLEDRNDEAIEVEVLQDIIVETLRKTAPAVADKYSEYRDQRTKVRQQKTPLMKKIKEIGIKTDRD